MSIESSPEWRGDQQPLSPLSPPRRRWPWVLLVMVVIALAGVGAAYALLPPGLLGLPAGHEAADGDANAGDKAAITDLLAAQQKTTDDVAAIDRALADQQEQLKSIVSQLAGLSAKIDAMQSPATPVAPSIAAPAPAGAAPSATAGRPGPPPIRATSVAPKQKKPPPRAPASTGPISVGGAPLTAAPDSTTR